MNGTTDEAAAEVERHHQVIVRWLTGAMAREEFAEFADAHAGGFTLTTPGGNTLTRDEVLAEVAALHGAVPGAHIEIRQVRVVAAHGLLLVAAYEEWQPDRPRQSTVVLQRTDQGLRWLHLHETWLHPNTDTAPP